MAALASLKRAWPSSALVLVAPALTALACLFILPVVRVLWLSVSDPALGFGNYGMLLSNETVHRIAWTTFSVCFIASAITMLLGYLLAYAMVHASRAEMRVMLFCILLTFWLSALVRTFSWIMLLRADGLVNQALLATGIIDHPLPLVRNSFGVILGMVHVMLPLAILPLYASLSGIDQRLMSAARGLGCGPIRAFLYVFLPLSRPGIIAACVLVFIFSLGFFVTPAILGGGKVIMAAEYIRLQFERTLRWGFAAALAASLLATVLLLLFLASRFANMRGAIGRAR